MEWKSVGMILPTDEMENNPAMFETTNHMVFLCYIRWWNNHVINIWSLMAYVSAPNDCCRMLMKRGILAAIRARCTSRRSSGCACRKPVMLSGWCLSKMEEKHLHKSGNLAPFYELIVEPSNNYKWHTWDVQAGTTWTNLRVVEMLVGVSHLVIYHFVRRQVDTNG